MTTVDSPLATALRDRYVLERELGRGGMATVYLAQDLRHHRQVAVKVLRPELAATMGSDRFFREVAVAARLQHPHILPLLDSGEAGGFYFYVMPYVAGESLRERLDRVGELPVDQAIKILAEVVDALAAAHAVGVVHRDIKPDNVMLSGRHALVMDFGVAKALSEATGRNKLTTAGVALGTPAYMAPEQAAADPHLDHRVDIYAVGTMGYELLTGHPPFSGGSSQQILAAHMTRAPEPISNHRPAVPPPLAATIMKCLEKRPADRYQTAEELLAQLEPMAMSSGGITPTQTRPVAVVGAKRVPRWVKVGALAAAVVLVAVAVFGLNRPTGDSPRRGVGHPGQDTTGLLAVLPFETIGGDTSQRYFTAGMTEEIAGQLSKLSALRLVSATATEPYLGLPDRLPRMGRDLGVKNVVEGSVRLARERVRVGVRLTETGSGRTIWSDQYDRDLTDVFAVQSEVAYRIAEALQATLTPAEVRRIDRAPTSNSTLAEAHTALAYGTMIYGWDWPAAEASFRRAIAANPNYATGHHWYADFLAGRGRLEESLREMQRAHALDPLSRIIGTELGWIYYLMNRNDDAEAQVRRTLALDPNYPHGSLILGLVFIAEERYAEAIQALRQAIELGGDYDLQHAALIYAYARSGDRATALRLLGELTERAKRGEFGAFTLAMAYTGLGQTDRAIAALHQAIDERDIFMPEVFFDPLLHPLRSDPRFRRVEERMGLAPSGQAP